MAVLDSNTVSNTKVKLRYREEYVTEGANVQAYPVPRGVYRGLVVAEAIPADKTFRVICGYDATYNPLYNNSAAVVRHETNGYSVAVVDSATYTFDMSAQFTGGGSSIPSDVDWYVYLEVDYQVASATAASLVVADTLPATDGVILLGRISMLAGDTTIPQARINSGDDNEYRNVPEPKRAADVSGLSPGDLFHGMMNSGDKWTVDGKAYGEPVIESVTGLSLATQFQLTGEYYVGKESGVTQADKHFTLVRDGDVPDLLVASSDKRLLPIGAILQSDGVTPLDPSTDADVDGFYEDPYIVIDFTNTSDTSYTGDLAVRCFEKKRLSDFEEAPSSAFPDGCMGMNGHADEITYGDLSGTPDSISNPTGNPPFSLQYVLQTILNHVNERIKTIAPDGSPTNWVLLWRSHNDATDPQVTKSTSNIYWYDDGLILLTGGYIDAAGDVVAGTGTTSHDVTAVFLKTGSNGEVNIVGKSGPSAGSTWDIETGWDNGLEIGAGATSSFGGQLIPTAGMLLAPALAAASKIDVLSGGANVFSTVIEQSLVTAGQPIYRQFQAQNAVIFTVNADYDQSTNQFSRDTSSYDSYALFITQSGILIARKDASSSSPWAYAAWDTQWSLSGDYSCLRIDGTDISESVRVGWRQRAWATQTGQRFGYIGNFRSYWRVAPSTITVSGTPYLDNAGGASWGLTGANVYGIDNWGFRVAIDKNVTLGDELWYDNIITFEP